MIPVHTFFSDFVILTSSSFGFCDVDSGADNVSLCSAAVAFCAHQTEWDCWHFLARNIGSSWSDVSPLWLCFATILVVAFVVVDNNNNIIIIQNLYSAIMPLGGYRGAGWTGRQNSSQKAVENRRVSSLDLKVERELQQVAVSSKSEVRQCWTIVWQMMSVEMARTAVARTTIKCCVCWCTTRCAGSDTAEMSSAESWMSARPTCCWCAVQQVVRAVLWNRPRNGVCLCKIGKGDNALCLWCACATNCV